MGSSLFYLKKIWGDILIHSAVLAGKQQSESVIHIHISPLCRFFSHLGHYRVDFLYYTVVSHLLSILCVAVYIFDHL